LWGVVVEEQRQQHRIFQSGRDALRIEQRKSKKIKVHSRDGCKLVILGERP
jgi:hypothetical protein